MHEETSDKLRLRNILQHNWLKLLKVEESSPDFQELKRQLTTVHDRSYKASTIFLPKT